MRLGRTQTATITETKDRQISSPYNFISRKITTNRQHYSNDDNGSDTGASGSSAQDQLDGRAYNQKNGAWLETRARRIMGNVKKSEERSRQLLLCEEAGGGELCRMLFKGHVNE